MIWLAVALGILGIAAMRRAHGAATADGITRAKAGIKAARRDGVTAAAIDDARVTTARDRRPRNAAARRGVV